MNAAVLNTHTQKTVFRVLMICGSNFHSILSWILFFCVSLKFVRMAHLS